MEISKVLKNAGDLVDLGLPEGQQRVDPGAYKFYVTRDGGWDAFNLLDTDSNGNMFILAGNIYGATVNDQFKMDPTNEKSVSYYLNTTVLNGGGSKALLDGIKEHLINYTWLSDVKDGDDYEHTAKLALLSLDEYFKYGDKFGYNMDGGSYEFRLSKDAVSGDNYILLIGTADSDTAESLANIRVYSLGDKLAVLDKINGAESEETLSGILKENAEVLELNRDLVYDAQTGGDTVSDGELNAIAKSVFGTKFSDMQSFYTAVYNTRGLLLLNSAKDDAEAESIGEKYKDYLNFKAFDGYDLIADFESEIYPYYIGKNKITAKEAQESFGEYAFLCAISKTENYRQVTDIFDKYSKFVTFDLTAWNNSVKSVTAKALIGRKFADMDALKAAIDDAVKQQSGNSGSKPGGGSGGSGGGGNGSFAGAATKPGNDTGSTEQKPLYNDIDESHWAYETVKDLTESKVINGDESGNFNPEKSVTRAEFAKMLVSAFGLYDEKAEAEFADVPETHWAYRYVASLAQKGIINGIDDTLFGADMLITRQDMAVMLARISSNFSFDGDISFADAGDIAQYAEKAVAALSGLGIINGYEDNTYRPYGNATRAEAAAVVSRGMKMFIGGTTK